MTIKEYIDELDEPYQLVEIRVPEGKQTSYPEDVLYLGYIKNIPEAFYNELLYKVWFSPIFQRFYLILHKEEVC